MIDERDFEARLESALKTNGVDNATLASHFGPTGQQTVRGWKDRGRIGQPSVRKVKELLPLTNMDWLQDGIGPELVTRVSESSQQYDVRQSYTARPDVLILAQALKILDSDEALNGPFGWYLKAQLLLDLSSKIQAGEDPTVLGMQLTHRRQKGKFNGDNL